MSEILSSPATAGVVVYDPSNLIREGALVTGPELARVRTRGVVAVDVDPALVLSSSGAGQGYVRRGLGDGMLVDSFTAGNIGPQLLAPILIRTLPGANRLHWAAELKRVDAQIGHTHGTLRLAVGPIESGQAPALRTIAHVPLDMLTDDDDEWIVQGHAVAETEMSMALPLVLSAVGRGVHVRWLAIGQM